ncbi:hypothetical protein RHMOL_Rhmol13G0204000 [Rhododendron molle]|uniref:Uncharacterized protein n=1 Tax=Rhododendron molle TaxID=49168 RepID=A0ACC0L9S5_RHOML|nr:hypothetical protein RHMOL_Rhmol13G0204000 [Rhododendron molle]
MGIRSGGTILRLCGNPERRNHGEVWLGYPRRGTNANCVTMGTQCGGTIMRILGRLERRNRGWLLVLPLVTLTYYTDGDAGIMCQIL